MKRRAYYRWCRDRRGTKRENGSPPPFVKVLSVEENESLCHTIFSLSSNSKIVPSLSHSPPPSSGYTVCNHRITALFETTNYCIPSHGGGTNKSQDVFFSCLRMHTYSSMFLAENRLFCCIKTKNWVFFSICPFIVFLLTSLHKIGLLFEKNIYGKLG